LREEPLVCVLRLEGVRKSFLSSNPPLHNLVVNILTFLVGARQVPQVSLTSFGTNSESNPLTALFIPVLLLSCRGALSVRELFVVFYAEFLIFMLSRSLEENSQNYLFNMAPDTLHPLFCEEILLL